LEGGICNYYLRGCSSTTVENDYLVAKGYDCKFTRAASLSIYRLCRFRMLVICGSYLSLSFIGSVKRSLTDILIPTVIYKASGSLY